MHNLLYYTLFFLLTSSNGQSKKTLQCKIPVFAIVRSNISDVSLTEIFKNPKVDGVTYYVGWSKLNPQQNIYDFSSLNKILAFSKRYKKKINLGVLTGR
ncbi:beta-galactosidase [uncultured Flavobacterium sp.]|uniref:beta-galactosidase n=1 Tax=uncultured Flavobacterium sp. TaxID=165435 RepID=UPI0029308C71|nr:beta-galactosidase [uncultured Flavobacterium sp.]